MIDDIWSTWQAVRPFRLDWIQVEVSAICNASCAYCVLSCYKDQWQGGLMEEKTFERLRSGFSLAKLVFLQGWGEPLLHPKFWEMAGMVKNSGAKVGFSTNGTLLDNQNLKMLFENQVDVMGVSLAGATDKTHDKFRKGCDFSNIERALRELKRMKRSHDDPPSVNIAFILLKSNRHELGLLPDLAVEWGASQIMVSHLSFIANDAMQKESLLTYPELWPEIENSLEKVKKDSEDRGIQFNYHHPDEDGQPVQICAENVLNSCFVSYRGDISPCVMTNMSLKEGATVSHYFKNQPYSLENYSFGNINEQALKDIWNSKKALDFRAAFEKRLVMKHPGTGHLPESCRHCYKLLE